MGNARVNNIITVGASAGGLTAVSTLLATIPADIDAAVFIVIHLGRGANTNNVLTLLRRKSKMKVVIPADGTFIERGVAYLAPVDFHMMLNGETITISKGAKENHWRPSIDVLFRTAAAAYDSCVIGIVLTGLLDDGTSGMVAIKSAGGICIVQDPREAEFPDMPNNVVHAVDVDYRASISEIGYILSDIYTRGKCEVANVSPKLKREAEITIRMATNSDANSTLGNATTLTCPDCGGVLTEIEEDGNFRYRCFTGHVFSEKVLQDENLLKTEETLWVAIRMMEERRNFMLNMSKQTSDYPVLKAEREQRAGELKVHIDRLKQILEELGTADGKNTS